MTNLVEVVENLERKGVRLSICNDGKLKCNAPKGVLTPEVVRELNQYKDEITGLIGGCESCRASGFWDYGKYAGKRLCFAYAMFFGKCGKPEPVETAGKKCPLREKRAVSY